MRFKNQNMTPGQYIKMYKRGGNLNRFQDGSEMDPGMYDPEANIYSPNWQMDENVQLYEEPTEENVNPQATEVVCQMCDNGSPINLPPNPDGSCPPGSTIDDGQTNPCDPNQPGSDDYSDIENQDPQADVKSGHRQKYGSKGTIPDWLTAAPIGDKGNLADLILTTRSIVNSYKPENYKGGKFSLKNLPTGQEGGSLPKAGYGWGDLWDDVKGAGKFVSNMSPAGLAMNTAMDTKADYDAGNIKSTDDLWSRGTNNLLDNTQQALQGAGFVPGYGIAADGANALISKGRAHFEDDPVKKAQYNVDAATNLASAVPFAGDAVAAGATLDMVTGSNVRNQIAQDYVDNQNDSQPFTSQPIAKVEEEYVPQSQREEYIPQSQRESKYGGMLPKAQTGYFDAKPGKTGLYNYNGDQAYSFGSGQGLGDDTKILTYDELYTYIDSSQAQNPRKDFLNSRPNVILTHDNGADWFDNHADWTQNPRAEWEAQVKQLVYSGTHGFNPATGALVKLDAVQNVHPDKKIIATEEYHDAGWIRLPDDPTEREEWIKNNKHDIVTISAVPTGDMGILGVRNWDDVDTYMQESPNQGYYQALTRSGLEARKSMLSEKGQFELNTNIDYDSYQDIQFKLDSLASDPNADPQEIIDLKLELLNNPQDIYQDSSITTPYQPNKNLMDTTLQMDNTYQHTNAPILNLQPGGELESDVSTSITLDDQGARPRLDASYPIASTVNSGYQGCYTSPTGEVSAACEIEGGIEFDPSTSTMTTPDITTPDQINTYTVPTGNQPFSDTNIYDADGDGQITMMDAEYAAENPLPTEETVTETIPGETIPGTKKTTLSMNPTFNIGAKGSLGYTSPGGLHIGGTGRAGVMGTGTQDINPYFSARGDVGYLSDNYSLTGFGEHGNMKGTDVGLRGSADLGGVDLYGEGRYNINTGSPSFMAGVRIPLGRPGRKMGGTTPVWAMPQLQTGGSAQGGYQWEWSPDSPDPLLLGSEQMAGPQNQPSAPPNQQLPDPNPVVPPMQDADNDGLSDFIDADSATQPPYGPENAASNIEPGTYDPDIYTFNQPELDEAVDTQDNTEYYEPEDNTPPDANDSTDSTLPFTDETDPGMDDNMDDATDDDTENTVNPEEGDTTDDSAADSDSDGDTTDDSGAVSETEEGKEEKQGRGFGETVTKTAENVIKAGKFINAWSDRRRAKKEKEERMKKTIADNMFEADEADISGQKGDYDTNSGIFRPDDKVSTVRKGRYGGALPMMYGGDPFSQYENGGEIIDIDFKTYKELIAAGAEIEIV